MKKNDSIFEFSLDQDIGSGLGQNYSIDFSGGLNFKKIRVNNIERSYFPLNWGGTPCFVEVSKDSFFRLYPSSHSSSYVEYDISDFSQILSISWYPSNLKITKETPCFFSLGNQEIEKVVIVSKQHPGESMADFLLEGILNFLNEQKKINFHFVVFSQFSYESELKNSHRYNLEGKDPNRIWFAKDVPEKYFLVKKEIENAKLIIDLHGDEVTNRGYVIINQKKGSLLSKQARNFFGDKQVIHSISRFPFLRFLSKFLKRIFVKKTTFIKNQNGSLQDYCTQYKKICIVVEASQKDLPEENISFGKKVAQFILKSLS